MGIRDRYRNSRINKGISNVLEIAKKNLILTIFVLVVFLIAGSFVGYKTTRFMETPEFCSIAICHASMGPYADSFRQSSHFQRDLEYNCMECHGETRLGPVQNKYVGVLLSHGLDSPPILIAMVEGKVPEPEFDPLYPTVPSERCLRCHAPDADFEDAYPITAKDHSSPIDVSEQFQWTVENPRGNKYVCKNCHSFVVHPSDTELLPTERGEKYEFTHPGFPKINFGAWQQSHWHLLRSERKHDEGGELEFMYKGESEDTSFKVTHDELEINGIERKLDKEMCKICHKIERLRPENMDGKCQGCHNKGIMTLYEHEPPLHIPNPNDYVGTKGVVGGPIAGGGEGGGH